VPWKRALVIALAGAFAVEAVAVGYELLRRRHESV
jgi:hypothetical protein